MSTDPDRLSRLADALLVAEATYQRARETHDRERSSLTERVLIEARHRLEFLEGQMFELSAVVKPAAVICGVCGGEPCVERWSAFAGSRQPARIGTTQVPIVPLIPDWATPYALRGTAVVSRYACNRCGTEIAVVTGDSD